MDPATNDASKPRPPLSQLVREDRQWLTMFTTWRAAQMTSILAPGIYWLSHTWLAIDCTLPRILRASGVTTFGVVPLGLALAATKFSSEPSWFIRDTAYRWSHDERSARLNYYGASGCIAGAAAGFFASPAFAGAIIPRTAGGAAFGIAAGTLSHFGVLGLSTIIN